MELVVAVNIAVSILFTLCYLYQFGYLGVTLFKKRPAFPAGGRNRYAVLISARNESAVIAQLIASIRAQDYPAELVTVFVVADNCTDDTAAVARSAGAVVYERFDRKHVGKGFALDYLLGRIRVNYPADYFDGFFVFDADNLLRENYISEMNRVFSAGYRIITSYRNSKNYGDNWISAGYSLWFLRESKYLNGARMRLGTSCAISGTGFLVHRQVLQKYGGWKFFLLTEDIEFSVRNIIEGERIAFCETAEFYDEQPVTLRQSWRQRMRWSKGFLQVFHNYGLRLMRSIFRRGGFSSYDMTMTIAPAMVLSLITLVLDAGALIVGLATGLSIQPVLEAVWLLARNIYLLLFAVGLLTTITEWKHIHTTAFKKLFYVFTFPLFMMTYLPIFVSALFWRVQWQPICHSCVKTLSEVQRGA